MKIVVIGGTGLIGSKVVEKLRGYGHEAVGASPESGVNTLTGEGLAAALRGASVVVDVSGFPIFQDAEVNTFFEMFRARKLLAAEGAAGVTHHVVLSVMAENGHFGARIAEEKLVRESSIPYSIVHATPFFESVDSIADAATHGGTVRLAPVLLQPVAADDVASAVGNIAVGTPVNGVIEVAGPERFRLDELIRRRLSTQNDSRDVVADPDARYFGATLCEHTLAPGDGARLGQTRFEEWLRRPPGQPANAPEQPAAVAQ